MNARFWIWYGDSQVKITLAPGEEVSISYGGPTDEGYSYTYERYVHTGDVVECDIDIRASDCAGRLDRHASYECYLHELRVYEDSQPNWQRLSASQRDYAAEAAGY